RKAARRRPLNERLAWSDYFPDFFFEDEAFLEAGLAAAFGFASLVALAAFFGAAFLDAAFLGFSSAASASSSAGSSFLAAFFAGLAALASAAGASAASCGGS